MHPCIAGRTPVLLSGCTPVLLSGRTPVLLSGCTPVLLSGVQASAQGKGSSLCDVSTLTLAIALRAFACLARESFQILCLCFGHIHARSVIPLRAGITANDNAVFKLERLKRLGAPVLARTTAVLAAV